MDEACPKLEESQRLDPGGGTLLNVALCHERQGRTASAWVEFVEARGIAKADDRPARIAFAQAHITALEPQLSRVVVQVPASSDVPDLEVKRDGSVVGRAAWGSALPVDPGDHLIEADAPGKTAWRQSVVVSAGGDTKTVTVPALQDTPSALVATAPSKAVAPPAPSRSVETTAVMPGSESSGHGGSPAMTAGGWALVGLGVAGAGVSTYFGLHAMALKNDADRECAGAGCTAQGASDNHDAIQSADISTVAAVAGIVGLGVGTVLLIVSGPSHPSSMGRSTAAPGAVSYDVSAAPGRGEFTVRGLW